MKITIHSEKDFVSMRAAGQLAADVLDFIEPYAKPGVSTLYLNNLCHEYITSKNAIAAPLNYRGFPKSICTSINDVVCHGIPSEHDILKDGDIVNIDITVILNGWFGDTSRTFLIGNVVDKTKKLVGVTHEAMMIGIEAVKPGVTLGDIGHLIQTYVESNGFSVVRDYSGHGIGRIFHTSPSVLHYGRPHTGLVLQKGMFFTIEPMVNVGKYNTVVDKHDKWTVRTVDGSLSAQFEHTIGVTDNGYEIFTLPHRAV